MTEYITIGIIVFCLLIEITPIKINPISWLGKILNKEITDKVDTLKKDINDLTTIVDKNDIDALRSRILADDMLVRNGGKITLYQYQSMFKDINKWKMYHEKYPELNGMINMAIENIEEAYKKEKFDLEN